ncbi:MAG: SDR family NAD(P)-dependent oxidoreductase [Rhodanobacter sp.]|nr:MAG: SDR family NAD(P)-dependent oxidoreductase [Rhodanobacter sp.]TAL88991.1 MAG: SDR family NAD(P)-dependent oxidoreductase [Rhodanobacter sp.]TAM40403.1 MAG: SDR family NAD(P)-dependent oxidoreductase [Rhodanobacter sp.]TAN23228.1 MAG: SDR family NAD(P)-dependent oxidoreductase [Rhodanobacter sp.]
MNNRSEVVVITGSSAGVGRATAQRFARDGANVVLLARGSKALDGAAQELRDMGCKVLAVPVDVADAEQVEAAAERIEQELGPIDIWINVAMATIFAPVSDITAAEFRRATEVTYLGAVHGTMSALKRMRSRNRGKIVQVGSALAYRSVPLQSAYCGAKFAIRGFTDALRVELMHEKSKITVTMVQLSAFNTPQFQWGRTRLPRRPQPVPPIYQPEVAADGIHYAAHHRRRELWVGFPAVKAILGNGVVPWLADRKLAKKGYTGQMDDQPVPADRPDNLFEAVDHDFGTHGRFDDRSRSFSPQLWATTHRRTIAAGLLGAALLTTRALLSGRGSRRGELDGDE